jgi:isoquinoline 1-oxidoreductase beta subunit
MTTAAREVNRREFLRATVVAGAGLSLAFAIPGCSPAEKRGGITDGSADPVFRPNAFIRIAPNGQVTMVLGHSEMGQGVSTSLPMLLAEELDADWSTVRYEQGPAGPEYRNLAFDAMAPGINMQVTGGSTAVLGSFMAFRQAGATARAMLVGAAAKEWGVDPATCTTEPGVVIHQASGKRIRYGAIAAKAAQMPIPEKVPLKDPKSFRLIGKPTPRLDTPSKVDGTGVFGIDVKVPGLLYASVARCPVFGGRPKHVDDAKAKALPGVKAVVPISNGIAVVAESYWQARQGRDALAIEWDEGPVARHNDGTIRELFTKALAKSATWVAVSKGKAETALRGATKRLSAEYSVPYLAHATMEPMNATAHVRPDGCTVWAPTQYQSGGPSGGARGVAAKIAGCPVDKVEVHTTLLGGGFGRRAELDFIIDAVETSKAVNAPVKVVWSREEDIQHGWYRPASLSRFEAGLDGSGKLVVWTHHLAGPAIAASHEAFMGPFRGVDTSSLEGSANLPYETANLVSAWHQAEPGVPVGFWRSVGGSHNGFLVESFVDELAQLAGKDPVAFRLEHLTQAPRHAGALRLAADKAGWGSPLPQGHARGVAVFESFGSYVAQVAEVSITGGAIRVHRVVCAVDCGVVVNPDTVAAQMEGAIIFGLTAALKGEISIDQGRAVQSNFHQYQMLRINEVPVVEVHIVPSTEPPGGVGEPGTPPIAPAVANAVAVLTGQRIRSLPIKIA